MPVTLQIIETPQPHPHDDFLLDDGLPCLRREGRLFYLGDAQPRVLEACRQFEIGFEQLADKLGMTRPALVLILKGYDPVPPQLKSMIDRLLGQCGLLPPQPGDLRAAAAREAAPIVTTIHAVPVPAETGPDEAPVSVAADSAITVTAEALPEVIIPQPVMPGRPAPAAPPAPLAPFADGLAEFTPGLRRRAQRRSRPRS
jgi:hypothetical protein